MTASPALADTGARPLNLTARGSQFTSFACLNDLCSLASVTVDGKATGNLSTGAGSYHADLTVDFLGQPAPGGNCNIVDEFSTFALTKGRSSFIRTTRTAQHTGCVLTRPSRSPEELEPSRAQAGAAGSSRRLAPQPPDMRGRSLSDRRILATASKTRRGRSDTTSRTRVLTVPWYTASRVVGVTRTAAPAGTSGARPDHRVVVALRLPPAVAERGGASGAGHLAVHCAASPGCRSVWFRPRCERRVTGCLHRLRGGDHRGGCCGQQEQPGQREARAPRPAAPDDLLALVFVHNPLLATGRAGGAFTQVGRGGTLRPGTFPSPVPGRTGRDARAAWPVYRDASRAGHGGGGLSRYPRRDGWSSVGCSIAGRGCESGRAARAIPVGAGTGLRGRGDGAGRTSQRALRTEHQQARIGIQGQLAVYCNHPACRSVWYRPRHEPARPGG